VPLHRLVYYSKYNIASKGGALRQTLKQILSSVIRSNSERGLTGGLIFNSQFFAQVLEGEHAAVMQTFARIYKDPRHTDIVLTSAEEISERSFGAWSMGFAGNTDLFNSLCAEYGQTGGFDPTNMSGSDLMAFILALVTKEERIASSSDVAGTLADA
jgi:Sensors of blue-light using FAD